MVAWEIWLAFSFERNKIASWLLIKNYMKPREFAKATALAACLFAGCSPDTTNMTCEDVLEKIEAEKAPGRPAWNIDGETARLAGKAFRVKLLETAALDKGCEFDSVNPAVADEMNTLKNSLPRARFFAF